MNRSGRGWAWSIVGTVLAVGGAAYGTACVGDEPATVGGDQDDGGNADGIAPGAVSCKTTSDCSAGSCIDGFCCNTTCDGQCQACDVSGHEGTCTAVTGKPHHEACTGDGTGACAGTCDGTNTDSCNYPNVVCGAAGTCAGGVAQVPQTCNNGTCGASSTHACALGCFQDDCLGVTQVAASRTTSCALLTDGTVRCWGDNSSGTAGQLAGTSIKTPTAVSGLSGVKMIGAGNGTMCAIMGDGTVKCWGSNQSGGLGNGTSYQTTTPNPTPTTVDGVTGATFISTGVNEGFCAIVAGGAIKCWGVNFYGTLGNGKTSTDLDHTNLAQNVCKPGSKTTACDALTGASFVNTGEYATCAVLSGSVACWGNSDNGVLGVPRDGTEHPYPAIVAGITDAVNVTGSGYVSCAATSSGKGYCWGSNANGNVGIGSTSDGGVVGPTEICTADDCSTHPTGVTQMSTYDDVSCALVGGAVKCWGSNDEGQLGDGTTTASRTFLSSSSIASGAVQITTGGETNFAVVVDGPERRLKCWGDDVNFECGDGPDGGGKVQKTPIEPAWQ